MVLQKVESEIQKNISDSERIIGDPVDLVSFSYDASFGS